MKIHQFEIYERNILGNITPSSGETCINCGFKLEPWESPGCVDIERARCIAENAPELQIDTANCIYYEGGD